MTLVNRVRQTATRAFTRRAAPIIDDRKDEYRRQVEASGLFDAGWYLDHYPDVGASMVDPLEHFVNRGEAELRSPGPAFHPRCYLHLNPDVDASGMTPLQHYLRYGRAEGRDLTVIPADSRHPLGLGHPALREGLFDPEWYTNRYGDLLASDEDPFVDYVLRGAFLGRSPSPHFDNDAYLAANVDVAMPPNNPLIHYLAFGRKEGRSRTTVSPLATDALSATPLVVTVPGGSGPRLRTAVVLHAYYLDLLPGLLEAVNRVPPPLRVFVTVVKPGDVEPVHEIVRSQVPAWVPVEVILSENRGRNFGPWLTTLGTRLLDDDVILHLHTKKSLYTGEERTAWRNALLDDLAGSPATIETVHALFMEHQDVGVVMPAPSAEIPYWASHWLKNRWQAEQLLRRMDIEHCWTDGYGVFPLGGMFWARSAALAPLLELGLTAEDFPAEPTPPDGTLAHAIERSISLVAEAGGYRTVCHSERLGAWSEARVPSNLGQYSAVNPELFLALSVDVDLVTVDLFDTLITRPSVSPKATQYLAGLGLKHQFPELDDFLERRLSAESDARRALPEHGDVNLDEIYEHFNRDERWTDAAILEARRAELDTECRVVRSRPEVVEALRAVRQNTSARVVGMSDTYLPRATIEHMLHSVGAHELLDDLYLSNEQRARKDTGTLWDLVAAKEGVEPSRWLHIGDNEQSDVQSAVDRGVKVIHCMNPRTAAQLEGLDTRAVDPERVLATELVMGPLLAHHYSSPFAVLHRRDPDRFEEPEELGFAIVGPVATAFTSWLVQRPELPTLDALGFLAREGLLLREMYQRATALDPGRLPRAEYIEVSRRAAIGAALGAADSPCPELVLRGASFTGTIGDLLEARAGCEAHELGGLEATSVNLPDEVSELSAVFEAAWPLLAKSQQDHLDGLRRYLESRGFIHGRLLGVVDVGYSATIQKCLQVVLNSGMGGYYFVTFEDSEWVRDEFGFAHGCFDHLVAGWETQHPLLTASLFFEAALCALHGQVVGYRRQGELTAAIHASDHRSRNALNAVDALQRGALRYFDEVLALMGPAFLSEAIDTDVALDPLRMILDGPWPPPHTLYSLLTVDDAFSGQSTISVGSVL